MKKLNTYYADYDSGVGVPVRAKSFKDAARIIAKREKGLWDEGFIIIKLEKEFQVSEFKNA